GGETQEVRAEHFVTSMPITALLMAMHPAPPDEVLAAARGLRYRDFLIVTLILDRDDLFPDNWIYVHTPEVKVGRIQNFKNWSAAMVPEAGKTCVGMEYFCSEGDAVWETSDPELIKLAAREIERLKLAKASDAEDGCVIRERKAYPVYDGEYRAHLDVLRRYLDGFENLQTVGRNGMHRYNNQDHSMLTAMLSVENIFGAHHDVWNVNVEEEYHEEKVAAPPHPNQ
ncbi:MAG: FAD-dependent oxidoreductase, partial [Acidimicrobiia bacterium]|nr:FAD-dependent oxidoreductase [Acidimicrobiia bacterium]